MGFWLFSGIDGELGWKTVPPTERSIRVNPINPCSKKNREVKRTRIERILSGGDTRSTSEESASILKISVRTKDSEEVKRTWIVRI